jgi:CHAT domain-containing protein/tetratricopeptide (TPR) repeat protein/tRNA A-37 threonylcarbamoyl transferase component Bud32
MITDQSACPSPNFLERLLAEQLIGQERDSIETHIETCANCQTRLETMLSSSYRRAAAEKRDPAAPEPAAEFLHRLKQWAPLSSAGMPGFQSASLPSSPSGPWQPGRRLGQYEILGELGQGGMGKVFRARHVELGKIVALKMLKADRFDDVAIARFKNEIRAVGRLNHPNIVVAHDAGHCDGVHFLVMEYVDGMDLAHLVERHGPLSVAEACDAIRQAAIGLQHAFERGLVHRDIKPSNLMVARDGRIRLLDLGLARSFGDAPADRLTAQGTMLGTADYLAPEQWNHPHSAGVRADIYSLGCTLFHLLAGAPPFGDRDYGTVLAKMRAHAEVPPPALKQLGREVPRELEAIVRRMLAKDPAKRFATPAEVAAALEPLASGSNLCQLVATVPAASAAAGAMDAAAAVNHAQPHKSRARSPVRGRLALVAASLALVALGYFGIKYWRSPEHRAAAMSRIEEFRVTHFKGPHAKPLGDIRDLSEPIHVNDSVRVYARFDAPTYCYLFALNPDGTEQLCFPDWEGDRPQEALAMVPAPVEEVRFFPDDSVFALDSSGLQVFVLIASKRPLPAFAEWRRQFGPAPWKPVSHGGDYRWQYDGREFSRLPLERGKRAERVAEPQILREVCTALQARAGVDAIGVIAFPVKNEEEALQLDAKARDLCREDKFTEALVPLREKVALLSQTKGETHFDTGDARRMVRTMEQVAAMPAEARAEFIRTYRTNDDITRLEKKGHYRDALPPAKEVWESRQRLFGPTHETTAVAAVKYAQLLHYSARYPEAESLFRESLESIRNIVGDDHPATAKVTGDLAMNLNAQDKHAEAEPYYRSALSATQKLHGEDDPQTAIAYNNLAGLLDNLAKYGDAEELYRKSVDILVRAEGEESSRVLISRNNLAYNLSRQSRYADAEKLYRQVLDGRRKLYGEEHPDTAMTYGSLGVTLDELGRHAAAEPLLRQAVTTLERFFGDNRQTAIAMNNLAMNLQHQGKFEAAEPLFKKALQIHIGDAKEGISLNAGGTHNNLAANLQYQGQLEAAREHLEKSLDIFRKLLPEDHPYVAQGYNNLASLLAEQRKYTEAEPLIRRALELSRQRLGNDHVQTAQAIANLGNNLHNQGKYDEAEPFIRDGLEIHRRLLGEGHSRTTWSYLKRVSNWWAQGKYREIAEIGPAAAASFEAARPGLSTTGLDRAVRTSELSPLLNYLCVVAAADGQPALAWRYLESRLSRGLLDDLGVRSRKPSANNGATIGSVCELSQIQEQLRPDTALVAWVDVAGNPGYRDPDGAHWGCVVRKHGNPTWVKLPGRGPAGAWRKEDSDIASRVRGLLANRPEESKDKWAESIQALAAQRLTPLESHLGARDGLPAVRHIVVLPSHVLAGIPLEALTDRYTISYAPSGTTLARLLEQRGKAPPIRSNSLLAVGDPNYQRSTVGNIEADQRTTAYASLAAARLELQAISRFFARAVVLTGSEASEQNLIRLAATGELQRFRFLHFATHGLLDDRRAMNSSLVLAQDGLPDSLSEVLAGSEPCDGRLAPTEIIRDWQLDADLVTLSACETALGKYSGGEGYLGFSQALFLAGGRSLLLSLWRVDDRATALLMTRFYENLLGPRNESPTAMSKVEALAEAKRWLRGLTAAEVEQLTAELPKGMPAGTRGVRRDKPTTPADSDAHRPFQHPYYWSAFVLIGDPS